MLDRQPFRMQRLAREACSADSSTAARRFDSASAIDTIADQRVLHIRHVNPS
jgi:hypothetical protein